MLPKIHGYNRCSVFPDDNFGYYEPIQNLRYSFNHLPPFQRELNLFYRAYHQVGLECIMTDVFLFCNARQY